MQKRGAPGDTAFIILNSPATNQRKPDQALLRPPSCDNALTVEAKYRDPDAAAPSSSAAARNRGASSVIRAADIRTAGPAMDRHPRTGPSP